MKSLIKFNTKQIMEVALASIVVQQAPGLLNKYLFKTNPLTGITLKAAGVGVAIVAGKIFKKESMGNIAVALAGADLANEALETIIGTPTPGAEYIGGAYIEPVTKKAPITTVDLSGYGYLNDYIGAPVVNRNYEQYY